jgi:hypothetical protein
MMPYITILGAGSAMFARQLREDTCPPDRVPARGPHPHTMGRKAPARGHASAPSRPCLYRQRKAFQNTSLSKDREGPRSTPLLSCPYKDAQRLRQQYLYH